MVNKKVFILLILLVLGSLFFRFVCMCDLFYGVQLFPNWKMEYSTKNSALESLFLYGPSALNILAISVYYWIFRKETSWYKSNVFIFFLFFASLDLMLSIFLFLMSHFSLTL
jgi:hypothetical protein